MHSFIVPLTERFLQVLIKISLFGFLRKCLFKHKWSNSYAFVDMWVLGNFALSFVAVYIYALIPYIWIRWLFIGFGLLRVFELVVYQLNVLVVDQFNNPDYAVGGYRRLLILSLINYLEVLAWFTFFYLNWASSFKDDYSVLASGTGAIYYSLVTMSTLGYGEVTPLHGSTRALVTMQTIIGMFLIILIISRVMSYLPKPRSLDKNEIMSEKTNQP